MAGGKTGTERHGRLSLVSHLATEAGSEALAREAEALAERLRESRFFVACVGQFKRGKSTLINALVGVTVLPTGIVPVTTAVTIVRHGPRLGARVRLNGRDWEDCDPEALATYVSEEHNPNNEKGVRAVEVFVPNVLLESGMCLVDTPGIGSVSVANTATTRAFVPHIDAALVVLGADPPISGEELDLVGDMARDVHELIFVLNKADRLAEEELDEAARFTECVVADRLGRPMGPLHRVSAMRQLDGRGPSRHWNELVGRLQLLPRESGAELVHRAEERGIRGLIARLLRDLEEQRRALLRPLDESQRRVEELRRAVAEAGQTVDELSHRLTAVQEGLWRSFVGAREEFFDRVRPQAVGELMAALHAKAISRPELRQRATEVALTVARRWLDQWRQEEEPRAEALYREGMRRFVELVNEFREATSTVPGLDRLSEVPVEAVLTARSRLYYTWMLTVAPVSAGARLRDFFRSRRGLTRAVERDAIRYLERLLEVNSARIANDFRDRVVESRRLLERDIRDRLLGMSGSGERALQWARQAQAEGQDAVNVRLDTLARLRERITLLQGREA